MLCKNCKKREGTENWIGEGSVLDYVHGFSSMWCKVCCLREQIRFIKEKITKIPELEKELTKLLKKEQ